MRYFELYDNTKTYISPIGEQFTPDIVGMRFAIVNAGIPIIIETDKDRILFGGYDLLSLYRDRYGISDELTNDEAVVEIERVANLPQPEPEPTAEERIASALEFQNVLSLPDETEV